MDARLVEHYTRRLGLKPVLLHVLAELGEEAPWRVAAVERGGCTLFGLDANGALVARRARPGAEPVAVGDWVRLDPREQEPARIAQVLERVSWLGRGSAHADGQLQLIAANLDTVFIVAAFAETKKLEGRSLGARRLERFVSAVKQGGATPVVVLNKVDLAGRDPDDIAALCHELGARLGGVEVVAVSAHDGRGLEALGGWLVPGETVAFIGPSGVGKSSLVNALCGEARQTVGEVRARDHKGRHTTTRRELLSLPTGALLIDTPGVRQFAVVADGPLAGFEDVDALARRCRFADCAHQAEPGCAVRAAVERGELSAERVASQRDLTRDAARLTTKHDAYARHLEHNANRRFGRLVRSALAHKKKGE